MGQIVCPVCGNQFDDGGERCPRCGRPRPGVAPEYMAVPWQRAATYIGVISGILFVCLLLLAPRTGTELSPAKTSEPSAAESSAPSESGANKEASGAVQAGKDLVVSWSCRADTVTYWVTIRGEVKNASGSPIKGLRMVAILRTADGTFVSSDDGSPEYDTILPGQTSPFEVLTKFNPAMRSADLSLKNYDSEGVEFSGPHTESCTTVRNSD
jgi:hypothetical protein